MLHEDLDRVFRKLCRKRGMQAALMAVEAPKAGLHWRGHAVDISPQAAFALASGTKLFTTALVLQAVDEGRLALDARAADYLPSGTLRGLHVLGGVDRGEDITLRQCLSNTSGLPCYFEDRPRGGRSIVDRIGAGEDFSWTTSEALERVRDDLQALFAPGTPDKAHYADTNYLIAGMVLEEVSGLPFERLLASGISARLGLEDTWVLTADAIDRFAEVLPVRWGSQVLHFPRALAANGCQGAVISTLDDTQAFLRGFFGGTLFEAAHLDQMQHDWRRIFNPFQYGMGLQRFSIPRIFTPFRPLPPLIGHSGFTGVVMYWCPERDVTFTGSTNQIGSRGLPYRFMLRALRAIAPR
jgi:D-alanyl-D-alanine carboxypeptidase